MADQQQAPPLRPALRRPGQPPRQIPRRVPDEGEDGGARRGYPTNKLMLIAFLGGMALLLGICVVIVQIRINQAHQRLLSQSKEPGTAAKTDSSQGAFRKTKAHSDPTQPENLYLWQQPQSLPHTGHSRVTAAQAYWNQFRGISPVAGSNKHWNPLDEPSFDFRRTLTSSEYEHHIITPQNSSLAETKFFCLQRAAQLGHPEAQHVYANALASGVLPLQYDQTSQLLEVADDFLQTHSKQLQEAWLNWHMAAISGHVEAAMALAHRYETLRQQSKASAASASSSSSGGKAKRKTIGGTAAAMNEVKSFTCEDVVPYYQAAAHGIMDKLEASPHSRAKVLPPMEKHLLYQVHLHGGTSSQLDWHNKPDESMEAIQFYHFKATRAVDPDPSAAMTLATLYHYGYRGVVQNLTLALQYYDVAAQAGSWEAAGLAGWFHVFGLGMSGKERDLFKAHKYFRQGLAGGLKGCQERNAKKKRFKTNQEAVTQCDPGCLNGMGLLSLFGVPLAVEADLDEAMDYFALAKEMGHADAAYNLAMVTLGWKSHYVPLEEALENAKVTERSDGSTKQSFTALDLPDFMEDPYQMKSGPSQLDMQHAVQQLMFAVQKGHLQARHRLAMLYDTGVPLAPEDKSSSASSRNRRAGTKMKEVLPKDCEKALNHYKGIVDLASPHVLHRLRSAYKDYIAGDSDSSLIQYMSIAELGNEIAQVNAAFLLEQGTCLGLSSTDCHKASVRYWKAAAAAGNPEACLRVGDFYYYGKLRNPEDPLGSMWDRPFGWVQYVIFPERYVLPAVVSVVQNVFEEIAVLALASSEDAENEEEANADGSCEASSEDGTCSAPPDAEDERTQLTKKRKEENDQDLKMAAHYYRIAAEKHSSPRANFNLAFLHQWGLGLTQDFPLAKRHYDLAASSVAASREADLAVQIALWTLAFHEYVVRLVMAWEEYWSLESDGESTLSSSDGSILEAVPKAISNIIGKPVPGGPTEGSAFGKPRRTKMDIILDHLWSWESLLILILTIILWILLQRRRQRTRR